MAGLWLNMDTVTEGMVRLIVPRARNLSSIIDTLQVDDGWLNIQIKALRLERPSAQKGRHVAVKGIDPRRSEGLRVLTVKE